MEENKYIKTNDKGELPKLHLLETKNRGYRKFVTSPDLGTSCRDCGWTYHEDDGIEKAIEHCNKHQHIPTIDSYETIIFVPDSRFEEYKEKYVFIKQGRSLDKDVYESPSGKNPNNKIKSKRSKKMTLDDKRKIWKQMDYISERLDDVLGEIRLMNFGSAKQSINMVLGDLDNLSNIVRNISHIEKE